MQHMSYNMATAGQSIEKSKMDVIKAQTCQTDINMNRSAIVSLDSFETRQYTNIAILSPLCGLKSVPSLSN